MTSNKCWQDLDQALQAGLDRVLLYGQPGTGKTYYCLNKHLATPTNPMRKAYRLLCSTDMTKGDIEGMWRPNAEKWEFAESVCLAAWATGGRLILDELDQAGGDALTGLLAIVDSDGSTVLNHPATNEPMTAQKGYQVIATTNAMKLSDLPANLLDRFPVRININTPNPDAVALLRDESLRDIASAWISDPSMKVSLRSFFAFEQARKTLDLDTSARLIFPRQAEAIVEAVATARVVMENVTAEVATA